MSIYMLKKIIIGIVVFITSSMNAQNFSINIQSSSIIISGTSNIRDWEMKANTILAELIINNKQIKSLFVKIPVLSIKSGNGLMDSKTYEAFNYKKNPYITFQLIENTPIKDEMSLMTNIIMASETKKVIMKCLCTKTKNGDYQIKGNLPIKMSDFKIVPPTALFGAMKTNDNINVNFDITFRN